MTDEECRAFRHAKLSRFNVWERMKFICTRNVNYDHVAVIWIEGCGYLEQLVSRLYLQPTFAWCKFFFCPVEQINLVLTYANELEMCTNPMAPNPS
jgi:hypothetical protein